MPFKTFQRISVFFFYISLDVGSYLQNFGNIFFMTCTLPLDHLDSATILKNDKVPVVWLI